MILAEKIMALRKQNGWSQEELAEKVGVSRQSVSKWESMQSVPDLDKILVLAQVFGVSTDYLLKEEMGEAEKVVYPDKPEEGSPRRVSMEEANEFLAVKKETSNKIAFATMLCILSPICLILFSGLSVTGIWTITENMAAGLGIAILLTMVVAAVAIFITCGMKTGRFEYLRTESIDTEYGVIGMVKEKQKALYPVFTRNVVLGVSLCILAVIPLVTASCITESEMVILAMVALLLSMVAVAVFLFISVGVKWESYKKLLQEEEYTPVAKAQNKKLEPFSSAYWLLATAIYLGWSFATNDWEHTWILWPVAGVLFGVVMAIVSIFTNKKDQ